MNDNLKHIQFKVSDAISIVLAVIMIVLTVIACSYVPVPKDKPVPTFAEVNDLPAPPARVTFFAAGDILAHDLLASQGRQSDGSYDYSFLFANMAAEVASYDIASITQETPFVDDDSQVSGYPTFGTPCQMADAIAEAGFDVVISATNHSYDKGVYGLETTMSYWKNNHPEITVLGIHDTPKEADGVSFVRSNGIEIAMAEFTYDLNGFVLPEGKEYMVDLQSKLDAICANLGEAEDKADFTIAYAHMGIEYATVPSDDQRQVAERLVDAGADVVIMSHVHVVQPMEEITTAKGNHAIVYYGLGNFTSNQIELANMLGGAAVFTMEKTKTDDGSYKTEVISHSFEPLFCHWNSSTSEMYFLEDYTNELASQHAIAPFTVEQVHDMWKSYTGLDS